LRLNPQATVAFTKAVAATKSLWNPESWHKLVAEVRGDRLQVFLDGRPVVFDGNDGLDVKLDAKWETAAPAGSNRGGAGIAFGASQHRGQAGGQQVRNIKVERLLTARPSEPKGGAQDR
jgi:hypothetical protein